MEELRRTFEALRFENVISYINSGNIAFDAHDRALQKAAQSNGISSQHGSLESTIETAIRKDFGKPVPVMVREQPHIQTILDNNPFAGQFESHKEMYVLFMKDEMPAQKQAHLLANPSEDQRFEICGREIYCHLKLGVADSLLGKGFIEKKLKVQITARNCRTVQKLASL